MTPAQRVILLQRKTLSQIMAGIYAANPAGAWWSTRGANLAASTQSPVTAYQESTGVTPASAIDDPAGLILDRRLGLVRGPELNSNNFASDLTGWYTGASNASSIVGGEAQVTFAGSLAATTNNWFGFAGTYVIGKFYEVIFDATFVSGAGNLEVGAAFTVARTITPAANGGVKTSYRAIVSSTFGSVASIVCFGASAAATVWKIDNVSVKLLDGNHLTQATAAARMKVSARVNLLTATRLLSGAGWTKRGTAAVGVGTAPDGTGETVTGLGATTVNDFYQNSAVFPAAVRCEPQVSVWPVTAAGTVLLNNASNSTKGAWNINLALLTAGQWNLLTRNHAAVTVTTEWVGNGAADGHQYSCTAGAPVSFYVKSPQVNIGTTSERYQWCDTATSFDTVGFPVFYRGDGIDDNAAVTFAAGTLTAGMSIFMTVKRNAATGLVAAFRAAASANYVGAMTSGGAGAASALSGTPTFKVNGVAVPGGAATTEGQLHTAMTVGPWLILQIDGVDASAWTGFGGGYFSAGYPGQADFGEWIICTTPSDALAANIRRSMAADRQVVTV